MCVNHFINVLITSILLCFILSEDSISWDKYTRYSLSNYHTGMLKHYATPVFCSFVWKGKANYTIGCEVFTGRMTNLAEWALFHPVSDFIIEELNEKSCDLQPCLRLKIFKLDESYCLRKSDVFQERPSFTMCDSRKEDQKWTIYAIDDRVEPAHFMIKATSTASGASLLLNKQELETNGEWTEPAPCGVSFPVYVKNQMTQSAATYHSPNVYPTTKNQTFGSYHIDSTIAHSTVSKTTTGLISSTMSVLRNLNQAKLFTNPTGNKNSKLINSKKSTTMTLFVPINHATSKNQKEYIFPTSSTSMYAATNYSMKAKAKTPPTMSTMLTPKSGKVSAVGNQDDTEATRIAEAGSLNLVSPLSTVKQCESTCLQEFDNLIKNCYDKEHVLYNGTKIPCNPMPETHQIVSKFMNMFGSMWVVGTSMTSAVLTLCMMPKLFLNQIQCGQDIMLGLSHLIIMFFVFRVDNQLMCKLTATSLIILLSIYSSLAMLECICVYLSLTNTLNSWNTRLFRFISCIFILCLSVGILTYLICFSKDLQSDYSCWINYNNHVSKSTLTVAGILFSMSMIFIETGISGMHKPLPTVQKEERKVCEISSATLVIRVILSTASFILTSYAVFSQNFALFPASFGTNVAFGWFNFFAHAICNKQVNAILVKLYCHIKTNLTRIHLYVSRKQ